MSINTRSGFPARALAIASAPFSASPMISKHFSFSRRLAKPFLESVWSSASSTRVVFIESLPCQREPDDHLGSPSRDAVNAEFAAHRIGAIFHGLKAKAETCLRGSIREETPSVILHGYSGGVVVILYRDLPLRRPRGFNDLGRGLMGETDELEF